MFSARIGDLISICCPHGGVGVIVAGSDNVIDNDIPTARLGDATICICCGCGGVIVSGSPDVIVNDKPTARVSDVTVGTCDVGLPCCSHGRIGTIVQGSPNIDING